MRRFAFLVISASLLLAGCGDPPLKKIPMNPASANEQAIKTISRLAKNGKPPQQKEIDQALKKEQKRKGILAAKRIAKDAIMVCQGQGPYVNCTVNLFPSNNQSVIISDSLKESDRLARKSLPGIRKRARQAERAASGPKP